MSIMIEAPNTQLLNQTLVSHSENETRRIAADFARLLHPGDVVVLKGELGAGKTVVVKAIAKALGYDGPVTSPSFTLLNVYYTPKFSIYHFDFYRIQSEAEALGIGADEYIYGDGICLIEWPEKVQNLLPDRYYEFFIRIPDYAEDPNRREIRIQEMKK